MYKNTTTLINKYMLHEFNRTTNAFYFNLFTVETY